MRGDDRRERRRGEQSRGEDRRKRLRREESRGEEGNTERRGEQRRGEQIRGEERRDRRRGEQRRAEQSRGYGCRIAGRDGEETERYTLATSHLGHEEPRPQGGRRHAQQQQARQEARGH